MPIGDAGLPKDLTCAEILDFIRDNQIDNVIFLTADAHANLINEVFVDNFADPQPVAQEFVTGPVATTTLQDAINLLPIPGSLDIVNNILDEVGVDCRHLDADSYGLVEVNAETDMATITLKDDEGTPLTDQQTPGITCIQTLSVPDLKPGIYLPAVQKQ